MSKNYHSYKRIEPAYFSTEIFFPVGLMFAAACISYGLLYIAGLGLAIIFNVVIAWCAYFYIFYYGKSSAKISFEFLVGFAGILGLLLFTDYGVYSLVVYQKTGVFNGLYFGIWLSIILGIPIFHYSYKFSSNYYAGKRLAKTYFKAPFGVYHDRELLTHIDSISFINSSKKLTSDIKLENDSCFYSDDELNEMEIATKQYCLKQSVFSSLIHIPFKIDEFAMSWYSIIEDKYYKINVPFPYDKLPLEQEKYPLDESEVLRGKKSKKLMLHLYLNGGFKLYTEEVVLLDYPTNTATEISDEERNKKIDTNRNAHRFYSNENEFSKLLEKLKKSNGIKERFEIQYKKILWSLNFSGLDERNFIEIYDADFHNYRIEKEAIEDPGLRILPKKIEFIYRGSSLYPWLKLHIDVQKLNRIIEENKSTNEYNPVVFSLKFYTDSDIELAFIVDVNGKKTAFADWEMEIVERWKKDIEDEQSEKREDDLKRKLLKQAWDFVFNKDYEAAQKKCDELQEIDPRYGFSYFLEARLLWYTKGFEACYARRDYFITKTEHEPAALAHIYNSFGCILDLELRYEESLQFFEKAIEINPKEPIYVCNLGEIYYKLENPKKALKEVRKAKMMGYDSPILSEILDNKGKIKRVNQY